MRWRLLPVIAGLSGLSAAALANGPGLPDTIRPALRPGNGTEIGLQTNFGMLDAVDGQTFTWICHETLVQPGATLTPIYWMGSGASFVASVQSLGAGAVVSTNSLFYSPDGCNWSGAIGTVNQTVREVAFDPGDPSHVLASTTNYYTPSGLLVSHDGGQNWFPTVLQTNQQFFPSVRFSPSDPRVVWALSSWYSPPSAWVYRSTDGGVTFSRHPWTFSITSGTAQILQTQFDVAAVSRVSNQEAWVHVSHPGEDYLLHTTDGGASFTPVLMSTAAMVVLQLNYGGGATLDSASSLWIPAADGGSWRSSDGVHFQPLPGPPPSVRGFAADARGTFAAANAYVDFGLGITSDGGASWRSLFTYPQIAGPRSCPADSTVATVCNPLYPALLVRLGITTPTPTPNPGQGGGGCSCDVGADGPGVGVVVGGVLLLTFLRRRDPAQKRAGTS